MGEPLTSERDTRELLCGALNYSFEKPVAEGTIYAGALVALNSDGKAVPAADTESLVVIGRAEETKNAEETLRIRSGAFLFDNGADGEELKAADVGAVCFVVDDHTVGKTGGTNKIAAGSVLDVTADGVAVLVPLLGRGGAAAGSAESEAKTIAETAKTAAEKAQSELAEHKALAPSKAHAAEAAA